MPLMVKTIRSSAPIPTTLRALELGEWNAIGAGMDPGLRVGPLQIRQHDFGVGMHEGIAIIVKEHMGQIAREVAGNAPKRIGVEKIQVARADRAIVVWNT